MGFRDNVHFNSPEAPQSPVDARVKKQLRSHPGQKVEEDADMFEGFHINARYEMFDLTQASDVSSLEEIMTAVLMGKKMVRQEKWAHDKDGLTTVTLAWIDKTPKKDKDKDKNKDPKGVASFEDTM